MKRTSVLTALLLYILVVTPFVLSQPAQPKGEQERLEESLQTLQDLYLKRVTLLWLADDRNEEKLATILSTFDQSMQRNFMANIKGDYQAVILQNFDSVIASHEKNLLEWASAKDFENTEVLVEMVSALEPAPFRDAFSKVLLDIKTRLDFKVLQERTDELARQKSVLDNAIAAIADVRTDPYDLGESVYGNKDADDVPVWWFDDRQYEIFGARPIENVDSHAQIDLNSVDEAQLAQVPGLDEGLVARILRYRRDHNGFNGLEELLRVEGVD